MRNAELHEAVLASPDDDAPRLVYADWLSERGDPRGEMISIAIAQARLPPGDPRHGELASRAWALWRAHEAAWQVPDAEYRRGFVEKLGIWSERFRGLDASRFADACLRELQLCLQPGHSVGLADLAPLAPCMRLRELDVELWQAEVPLVREVLAWCAVATVERLRLAGEPVGAGVVAATGALATLRALELTGASADAFAALAQSAHSLRALRLERTRIGRGALAAAVGAVPFAQLEALHLAGAEIGEVDVAAICASAMPLVELGLSGNALGPEAARAIAATPRFATLAALDLSDAQIGADGAAALLASPYLPATCRVTLDGEVFGLAPDIWYDEGAIVGASWYGTAPPDAAARFRLTLASPSWRQIVPHAVGGPYQQ